MKYSILLLLAVPALMLPTACSHRRADDAARQAEAVEVALPVVDSVTLYKTYPGYTYSDSKADIVARVIGTLLTRTYSAGTMVERGQVLFTIESTSYADAVTKAEAALATAKSQYEYLSRQYVAMEKALESDAVSQMAVIQARADMEQAKASIDNASAALNDARTMLGYCTIRAPAIYPGRPSILELT